MSALSVNPTFPIFTDIDGQPLENGYVYVGAANLDPQGNPINVYWDAALTQLAVQPIRTRGGYPVNSGTPARLYVNSDYSIRVTNKNGSVIYNAPAATDRVSDAIINISASKVSYTPAGTGAVATTVQSKLRESVSALDFMTTAQIADVQSGTGAIDVTAAIRAAIDSLPSSGGSVYFPKGVYRVSSQITIANKSNIRLLGFGFSGSYNSTDYGASINATGSFTVFSFSNGVGCAVENLQIKGSFCAIYFSGCLGFRVLDCNLRENQIGLDVIGNGVGIVRGNLVRDNTLVGLRFLSSSGDTVVTENDVGNNNINVLIASGGIHLHNNMIFSAKNSGNGIGVLVDASNVSANTFLSRIFISNNLIANNDLQIKILGTAFNDRDVQDVLISGNHLHQADDSGNGFDPGFAYGQGLLVINARRVRINHNIFTGLRDYAVRVQNAYEGVYIDHNHFRACNVDAVVFDLVQWGSVDHNQFVSNVGTAIKVTCSDLGDYSQNNRFSENSFQSNGAVYSEDSRTRANLILDNLGGTLGDFTLSSTAPVSQLRHPSQGGNQQSWKNQTLYLDGAAWNGTRLVLGSYNFWVDGSGRLRIKSGTPASDTDGTVVGTQT
jgi:hypothetical protein